MSGNSLRGQIAITGAIGNAIGENSSIVQSGGFARHDGTHSRPPLSYSHHARRQNPRTDTTAQSAESSGSSGHLHEFIEIASLRTGSNGSGQATAGHTSQDIVGRIFDHLLEQRPALLFH